MSVQRVGLLTYPPEVDETYLVPTVKCDNYTVPVIGRAHSDPVLGPIAAERHIHVDIRFIELNIIHELFRNSLGFAYPDLSDPSGRFTVFILSSDSLDDKGKVIDREMRCLRGAQNLPFSHKTEEGLIIYRQIADQLEQQARLEDLMEGKKLRSNCKVCPHHGMPLGSAPVRDGIRTCPGHFLDWSDNHGGLVRRSRWTSPTKTSARYSTPQEREEEMR